MSDNRLSGVLPDTWGSSGAFRGLETIDVSGNAISGLIPASWGESGALQALEELDLKPGNPGLCGPIPDMLVSKVGDADDGDATLVCGDKTFVAPVAVDEYGYYDEEVPVVEKPEEPEEGEAANVVTMQTILLPNGETVLIPLMPTG